MDFVFGFIGALLAVFLLVLGGVAGWKLRSAELKRTRAAVDPLPEAEMRRLREEQQAFFRLQNYTVEDAYGMNEGLRRSAADDK